MEVRKKCCEGITWSPEMCEGLWSRNVEAPMESDCVRAIGVRSV